MSVANSYEGVKKSALPRNNLTTRVGTSLEELLSRVALACHGLVHVWISWNSSIISSCRDRCLKQSTTVRSPSIGTEMEYTCCRTRFRRSPIPCAMSPMFVVILLKTLKLSFQIRGGPKQCSIEIFSPDRPDQSLDKRMR